MTDPVKDQISALLDDELEVRESTLLLARITRDRELLATWERYNVIGDCIRGSLPAHMQHQIAERVAEAVEEHAPLARAGAGGGKAWRAVAGFAVAASVAAVALVSLQSTETITPEFVTPTALSASDDSYTVPVINMREQASASLRERLNFYQVSHSEYAGPMQRRSLMSEIAADAADLPAGAPDPENPERE